MTVHTRKVHCLKYSKRKRRQSLKFSRRVNDVAHKETADGLHLLKHSTSNPWRLSRQLDYCLSIHQFFSRRLVGHLIRSFFSVRVAETVLYVLHSRIVQVTVDHIFTVVVYISCFHLFWAINYVKHVLSIAVFCCYYFQSSKTDMHHARH